ncbi:MULTISPECIES: ThiF family adenylyltransferase [Enterobacteriaceae]|uniref:ThiF family adenylyltransferase n=1 Tax=Enterobacteriaceae TaxID=543 RepID=UPI0015FA1168|nr:ThiF family adenylyltransferase [Citrobacter sp. RHBSTW-00271]MBA7944928.1 ThiF family adenylyltransferase [Citrobacter sp. RHBSTW-00271]
MSSGNRLILTQELHTMLQKHLFPGDGKEAAAILICNRYEGGRLKLLAKELILVPYEECKSRTSDFIAWPGNYLEKAIDVAEEKSMSIILIHSHPGGFLVFSDTDDSSDMQTMQSLFQGVDAIHGSAIMIHSGEMRARLYREGKFAENVELVTVAGDDIHYWWDDKTEQQLKPIAFTSGMTDTFQKLTAAIIGVSGTGSIVAEQVARLGFGEILLIDHDHIEKKNLNRILNSTLKDALSHRPKVDMFAEAIRCIRGEDISRPINNTIFSREAVLAAANADVLFCCVDTYLARMIADRIASSFLIPLLDVGVKIPTHVDPDDGRKITDVTGRIDYVKPGGSTLSDRLVYTPELIYRENLNAEEYEEQLERGYITGVEEEAPSVITLNMRAASACVSEFIARCFPFREYPNKRFTRTFFSLAGVEEDYIDESSITQALNTRLAVGGEEPLLGLPELGDK